MSIKSKIQSLITAANATTGETDATLTDAVQTLVDGYGGITPTGSINITDTNPTDVTNYATAQVADADLVAENIKKDVNILGVVGSYECGIVIPKLKGTFTFTRNVVNDKDVVDYIGDINANGDFDNELWIPKVYANANYMTRPYLAFVVIINHTTTYKGVWTARMGSSGNLEVRQSYHDYYENSDIGSEWYRIGFPSIGEVI